MRKLLQTLASVAIGLVLPSGCAHALAESTRSYHLGRAATSAEIARENIDVSPDGNGLPTGRGDAIDGAAIFASTCQRCHGVAVRLDSKRWPYATTLFDYVRRAMPPDRTRQLTASETYSIVAYELNMNGLIQNDQLMTERTIVNLKMPAIDDFIRQP